MEEDVSLWHWPQRYCSGDGAEKMKEPCWRQSGAEVTATATFKAGAKLNQPKLKPEPKLKLHGVKIQSKSVSAVL